MESSEERVRTFGRWYRSVGANVLEGVLWGGFLAVAYAVVAIIRYAIAPPDPEDHIRLSNVMGVYALGGLVGGIIFGLFRPIARTRWGAAIVGGLCVTPAWLLAEMELGIDFSGMSLVSGMVFGGLAGMLIWEQVHRVG